MNERWDLVIPVVLLAVVVLFGMIGCGLDSGPVINPDLISEWRLGEPTGMSANDTIDDRPGTYRVVQLAEQPQSPATADPPILALGATGIRFPGSNETCVSVDGGFVEIPFASALNTPQFSVMAWCLPEFDLDETVGGKKAFRWVLTSREGTDAQPAGFRILSGPDPSDPVGTTLVWQAGVGDGATWTTLVGPPVVANKATHLAVTYDGNVLQLFVNGSDHGFPFASNSAGYRPNTSSSLFIGMGTTDGTQLAFPFKGRLQCVQYYNAVQTADVIDAMAGL